MTAMATRLTRAPLSPWVNLLRVVVALLPKPTPTLAVTAVTTGAPNDGKPPVDEASTENYYAYLPLFVP